MKIIKCIFKLILRNLFTYINNIFDTNDLNSGLLLNKLHIGVIKRKVYNLQINYIIKSLNLPIVTFHIFPFLKIL